MPWYDRKIKEDARQGKPQKYPFKAVYVNNDRSEPITSLIGKWVYAISIAQARAIFIKQYPWLANASTFQPDFDPDKHKQDQIDKKLKDDAEKKRQEGVSQSLQDAWWNK